MRGYWAAWLLETRPSSDNFFCFEQNNVPLKFQFVWHPLLLYRLGSQDYFQYEKLASGIKVFFQSVLIVFGKTEISD